MRISSVCRQVSSPQNISTLLCIVNFVQLVRVYGSDKPSKYCCEQEKMLLYKDIESVDVKSSKIINYKYVS